MWHLGAAMSAASRPLVIAGGGLAGSLAALAMASRRPDVPLLLIESASGFGGNHVWSYFDSDIEPEHQTTLEQLSPRRWADHDVRFPSRERRIGIGYNSVRSPDLDRLVRDRLRPGQYRLNCGIAEIAPSYVILDDGQRIDALGVIDARGPLAMPKLQLGWQKFVGRIYRFDQPHRQVRPMIMDATVDQRDGYRFIYTLPFSDKELLIEDTYYSTSPLLDCDEISVELETIALAAGDGACALHEETGVLPVLLGGSVDELWGGAAIPKLGLRGGFFHPTTGYSLPDAVRNAALLASLSEFSTTTLYERFRHEAERLWSKRKFFQLLNRMLFHAAEPAERYKVLEHFYRLPEPVIARFYAARLTALDKLRILSGRPPVPLRRAIGAMRRSAA